MKPMRLAVFLAFAVLRLFGAEPWTDPNLEIRGGLQLWLDASRQTAAREKAATRQIHNGDPLDRWLDGSGHARTFFQLTRGAMPRYRTSGSNAWVHFDGTDDFLTATVPNL